MHFFFTYDLYAKTSTVGNVTQVDYYSCELHDQFRDFFIGPWYWIDALLGDFIPFMVVFAGNCAIVTKIIASKRLRAVTAKDDKGSRKVRGLHPCHVQRTSLSLLSLIIVFENLKKSTTIILKDDNNFKMAVSPQNFK